MGRARVPDRDPAAVAHARLVAAVDQTLALVREAATTNRGNRDLCNLALDVHNTLTQPVHTAPTIPGR